MNRADTATPGAMVDASRKSLVTFGYGVLIAVVVIACLVVFGMLSE